MLSKILFATVFVAGVTAQSSSSSVIPSSTVPQSMPAAATQGFNAALIDSQQKFSWCRGQLNTCPIICGGTTSQNSCDATSLIYSCVCSNGTTPDSSAYQSTLPFYICEANFAQCMNTHPSTDPQGQQTCMDNHQCGTLNATARAVSTSSSSARASATSAAGSATSSAATSATSAAAAGSGASMATYTSGAFAAVLMAAFKMLL